MGSDALVKMLISYHANRSLTGPGGMTAFHIAVLQGNYNAYIALYFEDSLLEAADDYGLTPTHLAAENNQVQLHFAAENGVVL